MSEQRHLDLVDRLRGQYHLPINDGAGPLNDSMTFSREFPTPPIQKEAADELERLRVRCSLLEVALERCADKLEKCAIVSGTDPEFAAIAVKDFRDLAKGTKP